MNATDRARAALQRRLSAVTERLPRGRPSLPHRRPTVTVLAGPAVPGVLLRLTCVVLAVGSLVLAGGGATLIVLGSLLTLVLLVRPGGGIAVLVVGFVAFVLATHGAGPPSRGFLLLLTTHLLVQLAALLGGTGWGLRVELRALLVPAPRFLAVQLAAQLTAVLGTTLRRGQLELPWLAALAAVALGALVLWLAPRLGADPAVPDGR